MTNKRPIEPPTDLVGQWHKEWNETNPKPTNHPNYIAAKAAQWGYQQGADDELEACCAWINEETPSWAPESLSEQLKVVRRPGPHNLTKIAMIAVDTIEKDGYYESEVSDLLRKAVERLQELEENGTQT